MAANTSWDPFVWLYTEISTAFFGAPEEEAVREEQRSWERLPEDEIREQIVACTREASRLAALVAPDGVDSLDGFNARRFILMQDKAARLSEHLYEDHEDPEGFMTMYQNIIDTSKKPVVARGLSEFDAFLNGVLNRAATRLSKLQTDYPKEAAQMKKDEETGKAEAAGKKRPGVRK